MNCRLEADVLRAAEEGSWTESLRRHVSECTDCEAASAVARWMSDFSRVDEREHLLPDPGVLWLKAQILRGSAGMERVAKPMTVAQMAAYLAVAAGWTALLTSRWNALTKWFENLDPAQALSNSAAASASLSITFFLCVLVLSSVTILVAMHTILAEE
ncbi:MAG TPA: hypothetical protein VGR02_07810 [Thermoanaerobaculia bacterium]|jgi:hypothetical protein|nr:hypothetical protein [Thermoanaerobaculia bacterium]